MEIGAVEAMRRGLIPLGKVITTQRDIDYVKLKDAQLTKTESETTRGLWVWGKSGLGKSRYARDNYEDIFPGVIFYLFPF